MFKGLKKDFDMGYGWSHLQMMNNCVFAGATAVAFMIGYLRKIGFNEIQISMYGVVIGIAGLFNILGAFVSLGSGNLKKVYLWLMTSSVVFCFLGVVISYLANPVGGSIMPLVILFFFLLWQIFTYMAIPALLSWLNNIVGKVAWGDFFSTRMIVSDISIFITSMIAGILLGGDPGPSKFLVIFLFSLIFAMLSIFFVSKLPNAVVDYKAVSARNFLKIFVRAFKKRAFKYLLIIIFLKAFAYGLIMPFQPVFLLERLHMDYTMIAVLTNISMVFAIFSYKIWAKIQNKFGNYTSLKWTVILSVFTPFLWMITTPGFTIMIYAAFVMVGFAGNWGIAGAGNYTSCIALLFEHANEEDKPICTSLYFFATGLAATISPAIGGFLLKYFNAHPFSLAFLKIEVDGYRLIFGIAGVILFATLLVLPMIKASIREEIPRVEAPE